MIAVPTKGAEHGVDIIVVRNPLKKSPIKPWWFFGIKSNNILGNLISNKPSILNPNNKMTRVIKSKKEEFWNCIPQLIEWPKCFKLIKAIASIRKLDVIPSDVKIKDFRMLFCWVKFSVIIEPNFKEIIGSTHGIKFNKKPPTNEIHIKIVISSADISYSISYQNPFQQS